MFRHSVRRLAAAAVKAADPSAHTMAVSKAQGIAKGLTGGMCVCDTSQLQSSYELTDLAPLSLISPSVCKSC